MKLHRVGLKTEVSAPGISGAWYEVGRDNIEGLDLFGGSTVVIRKGGGNGKTIAVPIENVAYFVPVDLSSLDDQAVTIKSSMVVGAEALAERTGLSVGEAIEYVDADGSPNKPPFGGGAVYRDETPQKRRPGRPKKS